MTYPMAYGAIDWRPRQEKYILNVSSPKIKVLHWRAKAYTRLARIGVRALWSRYQLD